jgi:hypothetical protein
MEYTVEQIGGAFRKLISELPKRKGKICQQTTNRKSRSGFRMKIFSPLGGVSVAIKSIFGE